MLFLIRHLLSQTNDTFSIFGSFQFSFYLHSWHLPELFSTLLPQNVDKKV